MSVLSLTLRALHTCPSKSLRRLQQNTNSLINPTQHRRMSTPDLPQRNIRPSLPRTLNKHPLIIHRKTPILDRSEKPNRHIHPSRI